MRGLEHRGSALRKAALCLFIAGSVGSDCSDDWPVGPSFELEIPALRANAIAHVKVPEGTWDISFGCVVTGTQSLGAGQVSPALSTSLELRCPRGMCPFDVQLFCQRDGDWDTNNTLYLSAQFEFPNDGGGGGCEDRNPGYVEEKDYDFFTVEFELDHVDVCEPPGSQGDDVPPGVLSTARSVTYVYCGYDDDRGDGDDDGLPDASAEEDAGSDGGSALDDGQDAGSADAGDGGEDPDDAGDVAAGDAEADADVRDAGD
jgi:hypothetical protein